MKLIKINQDHYVVVTDEPILIGDYVYCSKEGFDPILEQKVNPEEVNNNIYMKKITHSTQPLKGVQPLDISYIKSLVGEVDVEEKFWDIINSETPQLRDELLLEATKHGFKYGYNQCLEDNKDKRFSEDNLISAIAYALHVWEYRSGPIKISDLKKEIIDSLTQPKDTWEVEFIDGKLKQRQ